MITVLEGLNDTSRKLNENTVVQTTLRKGLYADAVEYFCNFKKWKFLLKEDDSLTTTSSRTYSITTITDIRFPGGIKEITIGDSGLAILPIDWEDRNNEQYTNELRFYVTPDEASIVFTQDVTAGETIHIWYYQVPSRKTENTDTYPIPQRYRGALGELAAAYVQYARYLDAQADKKYNLFLRQLETIENNQTERNYGNPKKFGNYLQRINFRRIYR